VASLSNGNTYSHDANGNQTVRDIGSDTYDLVYDAENRLIEVKKNTTIIATFSYDGDGKQVKSVVSGTTTYFPGAHYNVEGGTVSKYYFARAIRVAFRVGGTLYYPLSDHLGSTSLTTNTSGALVAELRYAAWGETRYSSGTTAIDYRYTGQREEASFGMYFYNARWFDPVLGRFAQADTMIPAALYSPAWDRYAYGVNNPIKYIDPTGHGYDCGIGIGCVKDYTGASTLQDFQNMGWGERQHWLQDFSHEHELGIWLDDIGNAIGFMSRDQQLGDVRGATHHVDAGVLHAIVNGWNLYKYGADAVEGGDIALRGAAGWSMFFEDFADCKAAGCNEDALVGPRLQAEDDGVNLYAWPEMMQSGVFENDDELARLSSTFF
jgi:RHS repeat-associated protein